MLLKLVMLAFLAAMIAASTEYLAQQNTQQMATTASNVSQNVTTLGMLASHYAAENPTASGQETAAQLDAPVSYVNTTQTQAYIDQGSAYAYVPPGTSIPPKVALSEVMAGQPGIVAGIASGSALITGSGQTISLMHPLPVGIPNGSMVYVSRDVAPLASNMPPTRGAQPTPPLLPTGSPLAPPQTFTSGGSTPVAWQPSGSNSPPVNTPSGPAPVSGNSGQGGGTTSPSPPSFTSEQICLFVTGFGSEGCQSGATGVWAGDIAYPDPPDISFFTTINYNGDSQSVVFSGQAPSQETVTVGGGSFTVAVTGGTADNCPAANPNFAGECIVHGYGTVSGPN